MKNFNRLTEKQMSKVNGGFIGVIVAAVAAAAALAVPVGVGASK